MKLFIKEEHIEYKGGRKEQEVINWILKKIDPTTKPINNIDEIDKLKKDNEVIFVYFWIKKD